MMACSHLLRALCDKWVYSFPYDFFRHRRWLRATGYGVCVHIVYGHRASSCMGTSDRLGKAIRRLCGDRTEIERCQDSCRAVSTDSVRFIKAYGLRTEVVR